MGEEGSDELVSGQYGQTTRATRWPTGEERSVTLIGGGSSCAAARDFVRNCLSESPWGGEVDIAVLLASELVANATRHAGGPCRLRLWVEGSVLRVEAADRSTVLPTVRHPSASEETGRGMLLVEVLAARWGVEPRPGAGKVIWFELGT